MTRLKQIERNERRKKDRDLAREPRVCRGCGQVFKPERDDARTCSAKCRQRSHRGKGLTSEAYVEARQRFEGEVEASREQQRIKSCRCSFCDKTKGEVKRLVGNGELNVYVCDECYEKIGLLMKAGPAS